VSLPGGFFSLSPSHVRLSFGAQLQGADAATNRYHPQGLCRVGFAGALGLPSSLGRHLGGSVLGGGFHKQ